MKKLIILAALIIMSASVFAQGIEWGAKAGLNMATETHTRSLKGSNVKMRPGLFAGVFGEYVISDYFGIQGELLYSMMGIKVKNLDFGGDKTDYVTYKTDYIVLPVLAKLYVAEKLSLDLGPQFGYMISAKADGTSYYDYVDKKFDVSFGMGLSYRLSSKFDISGRYNLGLTKLAEHSDNKNSVIQFGIGYRF